MVRAITLLDSGLNEGEILGIQHKTEAGDTARTAKEASELLGYDRGSKRSHRNGVRTLTLHSRGNEWLSAGVKMSLSYNVSYEYPQELNQGAGMGSKDKHTMLPSSFWTKSRELGDLMGPAELCLWWPSIAAWVIVPGCLRML